MELKLLIEIIVLALAMLLGFGAYREIQQGGLSDDQLDKADELDKRAAEHADAQADARARVEELEDEIVTREKEVEDVEASDPETAVDRLRDEFGTNGDG